ncbi:GroEL-like apical domain superfamily [Forsythia ovata]|uniref:GroEL-like apical domain superfamily n=1 Tax=Forsythia ovata TaxID=205694 RepID=A0ABD1T888_9LAMI
MVERDEIERMGGRRRLPLQFGMKTGEARVSFDLGMEAWNSAGTIAASSFSYSKGISRSGIVIVAFERGMELVSTKTVKIKATMPKLVYNTIYILTDMQYVVFHAIIIVEGLEAHQVAVFAGGVDTSATETKGTVLIHNAEQGEDIMMEQSSRLDEEDTDQDANGIDSDQDANDIHCSDMLVTGHSTIRILSYSVSVQSMMFTSSSLHILHEPIPKILISGDL